MAITIITEPQLREELGDLTTSTRTADFMPAEVLQGIIDHHTNALTEFALGKVKQVQLPMEIFAPSEVDLSASTVSTSVKEGAVPDGKFPFSPKAVLGGTVSAAMVDDIELLVATSPVSVSAVSIKGAKVYAHPTSHDTVQVWLAGEDDLINRVAPEELSKARQNIISEARQAVKDRLAIAEVQNKPAEM